MSRSSITTLYSDYWTTARVEQFIHGSLETSGWQLPSGKPAWAALLADITNHNGRDAERFEWGVTTFVDLLQAYRYELESTHGTGCWDRAKKALHDDSRAVAVIQFLRQLTAATRDDAVKALMLIGQGKRSVSYRLPGGAPTAFSGKDCGLGVIVEVTGQIEHALAEDKPHDKPTGKKTDATAAPDHTSGPSSVATIKLRSGKVAEVRHQEKAVELKGLQARLFMFLYARQDKTGTYEDAWKHLHGKEAGYPEEKGGPPTPLRTLKYALNKSFLKALGKPSKGKSWIETLENVGYRLNKSVKWVLREEGRQHLPEFLRDPRTLDGHRPGDK